MTDPLHLAIDLGASSGRVIGGSLRDGKIHLETLHRFANDPVHVQSTMQWNTLGLWQQIQAGLTRAAEHAQQAGQTIASVGVDSWGVDYVLLGHDGQPIAPAYHYRDSRNNGMLEAAFEILPREKIFAATGLQFMQINTLYQLLAAKQSNGVAIDQADTLLLMADYFHWLLTGVDSVEYTNASTTQLLDPNTGDWAYDLVEAFELPRQLFGPLTQPGTTLAPIQATVAARTQLHDVPVILPATHDTASAVLAVPAQSFAPEQPDWCFISSGTWSLMGCELPEPRVNATCAALNFTNEGGVGGSTRLLKNIGGLWVFQQIRAAMQRRGQEITWDQMVATSKKAQPFALLIDPDHQDFLAPTDMIDAICGFAGRTGQPVPMDDAVLYRAALEGLALRYRVCLDMLEKLTGSTLQTIHVVGGGANNDLLCQMTADACDRVVVAGPIEATAIGNVLMQMIGSGSLSDVAAARRLVRESFQPRTFEPQNRTGWDEAVQRFESLTNDAPSR